MLDVKIMNIYPAYISKHHEEQIILLMILEKEERYYLAVKRLSALLREIKL